MWPAALRPGEIAPDAVPAGTTGAYRWTMVLDELEAELEQAAAAARNADGAVVPTGAGTSAAAQAAHWLPLADLGPLPVSLAGRARKLLAGQDDAIAAIVDAKDLVGRQIAAVRGMRPVRPTPPSVYLDVAG